MEDFISSILNSTVDFNQLGTIILIWILALWAVFCVWVFTDANKRYKNRRWGLFWFIAVLIINFPALVLYFIVRPENEENHVIYLANEGSNTPGGINVPLINFTGEDGIVQLSLSLSLNKNIGENVQFDLKVNDTDKYKVQEREVSVEVETKEVEAKDLSGNKTDAPVVERKITVSKLKNKAQSLKNSFKAKLKARKQAKLNDESPTEEKSN